MKRLILVLSLLFITRVGFADESRETLDQEGPKDTDSVTVSSDRNIEQLLPGEEVTTPSGKKMKVWSTRGPVPVSKAPEPFEDKSKSTLNGVNVIVDSVAADKAESQK